MWTTDQLPAGLLLTLALVSLDGRACRLPGAGIVTCSFAATLAMALYLGPASAGLIVTASLLLSLIYKPAHANPKVALLGILVELTPQLAALALMGLVQAGLPRALAGGGVFLLLSLLLPNQILPPQLPEALRGRLLTVLGRLTGLRLVTAASGAIAAQLSPWATVLMLPLLLYLPQVVKLIVQQEEQVQRQDVLRQLDRRETLLEQASHDQNQLRHTLSRQQGEFRVLEAAAMAMLKVEDRPQTAAKILQLCRNLCPCDSVVVFVKVDSGLAPLAVHTPQPQRISDAALLGLHEAMVEVAWQSGAVQLEPLGEPDRRVFAGERFALAFPLGISGVLYLGRATTPFNEVEFRHLERAALVGGFGLLIASQIEELQLGLRQQNQLSQRLQEWSTSLDWLLRFSLQFLDKLNRDELQATLTSAVQGLFGADRAQVDLTGETPAEVCRGVIANKTPLLIDDLSKTRFAQEDQASLLCVPIHHPNLERVGLITLTARAPQAFTREHLGILTLLSNLAAIAWKNAELHAETLAAQSQLVQSSKMAAIGQLAAGIAHELNTPLGSITLNIDMVSRLLAQTPTDPDKVQSRLVKVSEMVERSRGIVDKLLYYSREARSGRSPTDLAQLARDAVDLIAHPLELEGVRVVLDTPPTAEVQVNQNELQQVLFNLLLNAKDAVRLLPPEQRVITLRTRSLDGQVAIDVLDLGPGIPQEYQSRLFEPFFTTKPIGQGTGLGLSVSQQIVAAHGGHIEFQSTLQGTTFSVILPT